MQFFDQFRSTLNSQLIKGISRFFQKLFRYFDNTNISTSFLPLLPILLFIFSLIWNKLVILSSVKPVIASLTSKAGFYLQYCYKIRYFLNNYHYALSNYTLALLHQYHEHCLLAYCLFCLCS